MGKSLSTFLSKQNYVKVKLKYTKTNHFEVKAKLNGVKGTFILDTGASSTCVGFEGAAFFNLTVKNSDVKAAGAGATEMQTQVSKKNTLKLGACKVKKQAIVLFDLSHVNAALKNHDAKPVQGIIGADVLKNLEAVIDYKKKYLYIKTPKKTI